MTRSSKLFIATVCAFSLANYPAGSFGVYARYGILVILGIGIAVSFGRDARLSNAQLPLFCFGLFLLYCLTTGFWSQNYVLTLVKLAVYSGMSLTLFLAGLRCGQRESDTRNPFATFAFVLIPALITTVITLITGNGYVQGNLRGMTGNSNTLGSTIALSCPWLFWELRKRISTGWRRLGLLSGTALIIVILLQTHSRASIGTFILIAIFAVWATRLSFRLSIVLTLAIGLLLLAGLDETVYNVAYKQFVLKRSTDVMASRRYQMEDSWNAAKQGGMFGLGFGISAGQSRYWTFGTFSKSSREKGSSQLAIIEETGLVGFVIYLGFLASVLLSFLRLGYGKDPMLRALCFGLFLGATMHSSFEAWFLATGPETAFFWAGLGLSFGALDSDAEASVPRIVSVASHSVISS